MVNQYQSTSPEHALPPQYLPPHFFVNQKSYRLLQTTSKLITYIGIWHSLFCKILILLWTTPPHTIKKKRRKKEKTKKEHRSEVYKVCIYNNQYHAPVVPHHALRCTDIAVRRSFSPPPPPTTHQLHPHPTPSSPQAPVFHSVYFAYFIRQLYMYMSVILDILFAFMWLTTCMSSSKIDDFVCLFVCFGQTLFTFTGIQFVCCADFTLWWIFYTALFLLLNSHEKWCLSFSSCDEKCSFNAPFLILSGAGAEIVNK